MASRISFERSDLEKNIVKITPLGGAGEIGKNCTAVEQHDDFILVDCGLSFPNEEMPGVDIVIPDFTYVIENRNRLRGIFITHAHEDHVGALAYLLPKVKCPVYASEFTQTMLRPKLDERIDMRLVEFKTMNPGDTIEAGSMSVEAIRVTHSIPESCALAVRTQHGIVLFTGDFKFDFTPIDGKLSDTTRLAELGREGVVVLVSDSTNVERPGWGPSERTVTEGLRKWFKASPGRILVTMFSSNIHRMQQVYDVAHETGRKVAVAGRRMEQSVDVCSRMDYLRIPSNTRIRLDEIGDWPDERVVILTTGSQGEPMSALVQMSKEEYSRMQIREGDTILYSARPIPGNEAAIWRTVNRLFRMGARVVYEDDVPIHVSGHAYQEELKTMISLTKPYYLAPVHGEPRHQYLYLEIAKSMGYPPHRLFTMQDGIPLAIEETIATLAGPVPCGRVLVDRSGSSDIDDEILRDRTNLANDGFVLVALAVDLEKGEIVGDPTVTSRGFAGNDTVLDKALEHLADAFTSLRPAEFRDVDALRHTVADIVRKFVHRRSGLRPLVVPSIIEI